MWNDRQIKALKKRKARYRVSQPLKGGQRGGLAIDVLPSGTKIFYYQYYRENQRVLAKIGPYKKTPSSPGWTLESATKKAMEYANQLAHGNDPKLVAEQEAAKTREAIRQHQAEKEAGSFNQLIESYLAAMEAAGKRSVKSVRQSLQTYVIAPFPELAARKASDIEAHDIGTIIARMIGKGITTHSNRVRSYLSAAFTHGLQQDNNPRFFTEKRVKFGLKYNPVAFVPKQSDYEKAGEHVITEDEIRLIWTELQHPPLISLLTKLALATGQRAGELSRLEWQHVDFDQGVFTIPASISKNKVDHLVPLKQIGMEVLTEAHEITKDYRHIFTGKYKDKFINGKVIHNSTIAVVIRDFCKQQQIGKFIARDIRRTWKTLAGKAGLSKEIRDRIQNHAIRDVSSKHYDKYDYLTEKREAMRVWNDYLDLIIRPRKKVAHISGAKA